ncbi:hypothetical protein B0H16DRAFT_1504337 [Mycena metata]|uniref:F-box domain-containing protein n=1 Tax=Mycena metata TaxID=1033252 RepID=A0AAD7NVQ4_9AGAR|nr:hypothetical protein B0H16DRAFT_1504337 [Mycena metata]
MSSFAVGPWACQNQYSLVNKGGYLRLTTIYRPILALPPEILAEIFIHCLPEDPGSPDPKDAPYLLCHVCHQFREVAVSIPRLWSSLHVCFDDLDKYVNFCRNGIETWLLRAKSVPLSLILDDDWGRECFSFPSPDDTLLPALLRSSGQWRSLTLAGSLWANLFESGSLSGKVPLLENLCTSLPCGAVLLQDAPKLCVLSVGRHRPETQVPWHQMTTFHALYNVDIPSLIEILQNSTNLLHASFMFHAPFNNEPSPLPVSNCRHALLQRLALIASDWEGTDERAIPMSLLEFLKLPALKDLTVKLDPEQSAPVVLTPLLSFLSQPALQLHTLALSLPHPPTMMEDLIKCLEQVPSLIAFHFHCPSFTGIDILFTQLTGHVNFLPRLEHLHLLFSCSPPSHLMPVVIGMLGWRWAAVGITRLQSFGMLHRYAYRRYGSEPPVFVDLLKAESEFRRLEGEGMLLAARGMESADADRFWCLL